MAIWSDFPVVVVCKQSCLVWLTQDGAAGVVVVISECYIPLLCSPVHNKCCYKICVCCLFGLFACFLWIPRNYFKYVYFCTYFQILLLVKYRGGGLFNHTNYVVTNYHVEVWKLIIRCVEVAIFCSPLFVSKYRFLI